MTNIWPSLLFIICLVISIATLLEGCFKDICPSYIPTHGTIQSFYSKKNQNHNNNKDKDIEYYSIYANILWDNTKICSANLGKNFKTNTTSSYNIDENIEVYIKKSNKDSCVIDIDSTMESNAITSMIFFGFTGITLVYILSRPRSGPPQIRFVKVNNDNQV
jgi:hypothetical protein